MMWWAESMFDHSPHCATLATGPGVVLCSPCHLQQRCTVMLHCTGSVLIVQCCNVLEVFLLCNVAMYWKCSYCAMLQCTGSVLTVQFISYCEYWTLPKSKYCNENREIYINKQQNGKQESKKWKCVFWHIFCLYFWLYLLGSKHKQMYCEKRKC